MISLNDFRIFFRALEHPRLIQYAHDLNARSRRNQTSFLYDLAYRGAQDNQAVFVEQITSRFGNSITYRAAYRGAREARNCALMRKYMDVTTTDGVTNAINDALNARNAEFLATSGFTRYQIRDALFVHLKGKPIELFNMYTRDWKSAERDEYARDFLENIVERIARGYGRFRELITFLERAQQPNLRSRVSDPGVRMQLASYYGDRAEMEALLQRDIRLVDIGIRTARDIETVRYLYANGARDLDACAVSADDMFSKNDSANWVRRYEPIIIFLYTHGVNRALVKRGSDALYEYGEHSAIWRSREWTVGGKYMD
jgi:hypothetical protein